MEQERILLFSILANPKSLVHARCYLGLGDQDFSAPEIKKLCEKYGSITSALEGAHAEDFPAKSRVRAIAERVEALREFVASHTAASIDAVLEKLFPKEAPGLEEVRSIVDSLREEEDTVRTLHAKFVDYLRTIPVGEQTVRVMTLMGSKGLEAEDVYIIGCSHGNIPGVNRSRHIADTEHRDEQRRLLYVGFTRAKKSLTVAWSRYVPFHQAKGQYTETVGTVTKGKERFSTVGISEFLQDLSGVKWEK